jgi:hypothetical protein
MTRDELIAQYLRDSWRLIPVKSGEKECHVKGWRTKAFTREDITENVAVLLGHANLYDVDCDNEFAVRAARYCLAPTRTFGRKGKPTSHYVYLVEGAPFKTKPFHNTGTKSMVVELRGLGGYTIFPPSIHVSGEDIAWDNNETT